MPSDGAAVRLTELIEALPRAPANTIPPRIIAGRLVALLPKGKALPVLVFRQRICGKGLTRDAGSHG